MGRLEGLKDEANKAIVRYLEAKLEHLEGQRVLALLAMAKVEEDQEEVVHKGSQGQSKESELSLIVSEDYCCQ